MNNKKIYVYIQTYQLGFPYLRRALDSLLRQTYHNWEGVIYDNMSGTDLRDLLNEYVEKDPRFSVTYIDEKVSRPAWKYGIPDILSRDVADEGLYFILDADDELTDNCFEKMVMFMEDNHLDFVASGSLFVNAQNQQIMGVRCVKENLICNGAEYGKVFPETYQIMRTHWAKLYKNSVLRAINTEAISSVTYGGDTTFVREALILSARIGIMKECLYKYYVYPEIRSYNYEEGRITAPETLYQKDINFLIRKCGEVSNRNINHLLEVYLSEAQDVIGIIIKSEIEDIEKIRRLHKVIFSEPSKIICEISTPEIYIEVCRIILNAKFLVDDKTLSLVAQILGIVGYVPNELSMYNPIGLYQLLVREYNCSNEYNVRRRIMDKVCELFNEDELLKDLSFDFYAKHINLIMLIVAEEFGKALEYIINCINSKNYYLGHNKKELLLVARRMIVTAGLEEEWKNVF